MIAIIIKMLLSALGVVFSGLVIKDFKKVKAAKKQESGTIATSAFIGGVSYFFDALGIGSYATSTALLRAFKQIPDKLLPGTLNVTCTVPSIVEALIFMNIIAVDYMTLLCMVAAATFGGWLGGTFVSKLPEQKIRLAMSLALLIPASSMLLHLTNLFPTPISDAIGLTGIKLIIATIVSCIVGALASVGIGFFAPCLALVYTLGMSAKAAFPIMMCAAATIGSITGFKFMQAGAYNVKLSAVMIITAIIGIIIAAYIVKSLPLNILSWIVTAIIYYTSVSLFISFYKNRTKSQIEAIAVEQ